MPEHEGVWEGREPSAQQDAHEEDSQETDSEAEASLAEGQAEETDSPGGAPAH